MTQDRQFNEWEFRGRPAMLAVVIGDTKLSEARKAKPSTKKRTEVKRLRELPKSADKLKWEKFGSIQRARFENGWLVKSNSGALTFAPD